MEHVTYTLYVCTTVHVCTCFICISACLWAPLPACTGPLVSCTVSPAESWTTPPPGGDHSGCHLLILRVQEGFCSGQSLFVFLQVLWCVVELSDHGVLVAFFNFRYLATHFLLILACALVQNPPEMSGPRNSHTFIHVNKPSPVQLGHLALVQTTRAELLTESIVHWASPTLTSFPDLSSILYRLQYTMRDTESFGSGTETL